MSYNLVNKTTGALTRVAGNVASADAEDISYDNTNSGLTADDVQDAIDEVVGNKQDTFERISYSAWQLLTPQQQAAKPYYIYDYPSSAITAGNVAYDNTSSGMSADDVQEAVDELKNGLNDIGSIITPSVGTNVTLLNGGYSVIGNMVYVDISILTTDIIPVNTTIVRLVNKNPVINDTPMSIYNANTFDLVKKGRVFSNGAIIAGESLTANATYIIVGCYIKTS